MRIENIEQLFTKSDKLNSAMMRREWFQDEPLVKSIFESTYFLEQSSSFLKRLHCFHFKLDSHPVCKICGKLAHFNPFGSKFGVFNDTCNSKSCTVKNSTVKRTATCLAKFGAKVSKNHVSKNPNAVKHFIELGQITLGEKRAHDKDFCESIQSKKTLTLISNYGVNHPSKIKKISKARIEKSLGFFSSLTDTVEVMELLEPKITNRLVKFKCLKCNIVDIIPTETFKWRIKHTNTGCFGCSGISVGSLFQKDIADFVKSIYSGTVVINDRSILSGYELDIVLPEKNLSIECNGVFWHSTKSLNEDREYKSYHLNKTLNAKAQGFKLIHIFEDEWINKKEIIKGRLTSLINPNKIFARKCDLITPTIKQQKEFLNSNHIQGFIASTISYALTFNGEIVMMMTFGKCRFNHAHDLELLRMCSKSGSIITGGASKLFRKFLQDNKKSVITYSDRLWGEGDVYKKLGFKSLGTSAPSYRWIKNFQSLSRYQTQKHKLIKILDNFDINLTESENMFNNGFRRIWDCGTSKWNFL